MRRMKSIWFVAIGASGLYLFQTLTPWFLKIIPVILTAGVCVYYDMEDDFTEEK